MRKRAHRLFVGPQQGATGEINVTPLVDVVLVLLIIFMVVTPLLEKDIPVQTLSESTEPAEVPPDQIVVVLDRGGRLKLNSEPVEPAELVSRLARILQPRAVPDRTVFVVAHDDCSYAELVTVLDAARTAGASVVGVPTDPADPQSFL
jgi:biopolymer transport protein ExbD